MAPWLGAQEALYNSLLWHLDVPQNYTSQITNNRTVFPGESLVNVNQPQVNLSSVSITGNVEAWVTDIECATSCRPKMYGFDFARVTEVFVNPNGKKRLVVEKSSAARKIHAGDPGERAMMKDLMLSTLAEGGEVCLSYHMLNPFLQNTGEVKGPQIAAQLEHASPILPLTNGYHLGNTDFVDLNTTDGNVQAARDIIEENAKRLGDFLNEVLGHALSAEKNIYIRLLHEPNIGFFWWGEPKNGPTPTYHTNFKKLWNFIVDKINAQVDQARRERLKYVFCINGKANDADLTAQLDQYFPAAGNTLTNTFLDSISVLGLDYYEDWYDQTQWANTPTNATKLLDQYQIVVNKVADVAQNHQLIWEHALTEVSMRTDFKGKLYGAYAGKPAWAPVHRTFFTDAVFQLASLHNPKWVLFWVNRVGNSVLTSYTPTTAAKTAGNPPLFYHAGTNVFTSSDAELYHPMYPAEPFYLETFKAGDASGNKTFFKISISDANTLAHIPGAYKNGKPTPHGYAYNSAIVDFFNLVPAYKRAFNKTKLLEVEAFLKGQSAQRPILAVSPTASQQTQDVFETL